MSKEVNFNLDNRYILTKKLAKGGTSVVYLAVDATGKLKKERAVKCVKAPADKEQYKAYKQEVALLDELRHPNIVDVEYFSEKEGCFFVVMNFIKGCTLSDKLKKEGIASESFAVDMALTLCNVLGYLHTVHDRPIIFSDLKPENIMIDEHNIPFLLDLGIAHEVTPGQKDTAKPLGTKGYAAPEQYESGTRLVDERTDVYALGAVLFKMLTGERPKREFFPPKEGKPAVRNNAKTLNPSISSGMAHIISKCMDPNPDNRFKNMEEVKNSLNNLSLMNEQYISGLKRKLSFMYASLIACGVGLLLMITGGIWFNYTNTVEVAKHITSAESYVTQGNIESAKDEYLMALTLNSNNVTAIEEMYDAVYDTQTDMNIDTAQEAMDMVRTNTKVKTIIKNPAFALRLARDAISLNTSVYSDYASEILKGLQGTRSYKKGEISKAEVDALALIAESNSAKVPDQKELTESLNNLIEVTENSNLSDTEKANNYYIVLLLYDAFPDYFNDIKQYEDIANKVGDILDKNQNNTNFTFSKKVGVCQSVASHLSTYAESQTDASKKTEYLIKAEKWYQRLGNVPLDISGYINRGNILMSLGSYSDAKAMYREALSKDGSNRLALIGLTRASINEQKALGGSDFSEAKNYYNMLLSLGTDNLTQAALDQLSSLKLEISQL